MVSRSKQLQLYKGNWATIEIMKTLIKNQCCYRSRIGTFDGEQEIKKEESQDEESDQEGSNVDDGNNGYSDGNNSDDWDDMYMPDVKLLNRSVGKSGSGAELQQSTSENIQSHVEYSTAGPGHGFNL